MNDVGLSYLTLGQPSTTLGRRGAAHQARHAAAEAPARAHGLSARRTDHGLHPQDIARLVGALQKLVDAGHTVIVIEHNLDVIRAAIT